MNIKTKTGIGMALAILIAAVAMAAPAAAYTGDHPLTVYEQDTVTGGLIYIVNESGINCETYRCLNDTDNPCKTYHELTQNLDLVLPPGATVKTARLYNYYTWSDPGPINLTAPGTDVGAPAEAYIQFSTPSGGLATAISSNPANCTIPGMINCDVPDCNCPDPILFTDSSGREVRHYWDIKDSYTSLDPKYGWRWRFPGGTFAWNVTDLVAAGGTGAYTATIMNAKPDTLGPDERFCSYGFALLVIYCVPDGPTIEYWIAEGMDLLYAKSKYGITPAMATASATFTGEFSGDAELHMVTSASTANITLNKNTVYFNGVPLGSAHEKNKYAVGHDVYDVTGLSNPVNVAEIEDTLADYFEVRNFFLVAEVQPIAADVTIEPETLNLKSNGEWVTAYIELPDSSYNVSDIDLDTVLLDCIPAVTDPQYGFVTDPASYLMDHDGDGIQERMVKFDRVAVIEYLGTYDFEGDTGTHRLAELFVTGQVAGTPFKGSDTVRVLH